MHRFRREANTLAHPSKPREVERSKEKAAAALKNLLESVSKP
jgi:hypothetical protein